MHLSPSCSAVLVLSTAAGSDPISAGFDLCELAGIGSVTAYPERGQLIVRYDPERVSADDIRAVVLPDVTPYTLGPWLSAWPRVADALPIAAGLL
jgi:hypothetical protein